MNWPKELKVRTNYFLKDKTTFRIGGAAQFFCEPKDAEELKSLIGLAKRNKLPVHILGAGSNLLISDKGVRGLVIELNSPFFKALSLEGEYIRAGSGIRLGQIIKYARDNSLQGLEFLIGVPGTLGGALAMNAGCWGYDIGGLTEEALVMNDSGRIKTLSRDNIEFSYRRSSLTDCIILSALLRLKKGKSAEIKRNISKYLTARRKTQDLTWPNAGCIFKNPKDSSAGMLIDSCGLKGSNIGGAFISGRHANFMLNKGKASAKDVSALMQLVKKEVKRKFKLTLQPEIKIWE